MKRPFFAAGGGMSNTLGLFLSIVSFGGLLSTAQSQAVRRHELPNSPTPAYQQTDSHREGLIHLDVSVMDSQGESVPGLSPDKFTLLDNGVPTQLLSFRESGSPVDENEQLTEVVLVLDQLNLEPEQFESVRRDVIRFLKADGGKLAHPVSIYWLTREGLRASDGPTINGDELAAEVSRNFAPRIIWQLHPPSTPDITAASDRYELWEQGLRVLYSAALERRDKPGRKALVWIGYGWPALIDRGTGKDIDFYKLGEVITRLREARLAVFQIPIWPDPQIRQFNYADYVEGVRSTSDLEKPAPHFSLPVLAYQSGGVVFDNKDDLALDLERCIHAVRAFYTISFDPPHTAQIDQYHELKVEVSTPGVTVRTVTGYYDQPAFYDQPRIPENEVSVARLEEILASSAGVRDEELSSRLAGMKLTERLSSARLAVLRDCIPGRKAKLALTALADESVFLASPDAEITNDPAPDRAAQVQILSRTAQYVNSLIPKLPDFFATRTTFAYQQQSSKGGDFWKSAAPDQSLKIAGKDSATLLYRHGQEEQQQRRRKYERAGQDKYLDFRGVFGPILGFVLRDATHNGSTLTWSRWEHGDAGTVAVFRYRVRGASPDYAVEMCCLRSGAVFQTRPEYHGEITIDPETGAVLRLTMESEPGWIREPNLQTVRPVLETGTMIEYGPVEIGGRSFTCPLRSVVMMRSRTARSLSVMDERVELYTPYETLLNDIVYTNYHKFGSESRIIPDYEPAPK
jgi:VWFA-related protein